MKYRIKLSFGILIILFITIFQFCRKEEIKSIIKVTTSEISGVTTKNAKAKGDIVDIGGGISEHGHCWSTSGNPTISDNITNLGSINSNSSFTSSIDGLSPGTTYYVRAYACSSPGGLATGINVSYGDVRSFTTESQTLVTFTTGNVSEITPTSAKVTSLLNNLGNGIDSVFQHGHCWSTSQEPTISSNKTELGSRNSTGEFTSDITGLQKDTKYYVKAYAISDAGTAYGNEISFFTYTRVPDIITLTAGSITENSAESGGNITDDGGAAITTRGVCWSTSQNPTILDNTTSDGSGTGHFTSFITGLSRGIIYYVRAYATNSICTAYGNEINFISGILPTIFTSLVTDITYYTATSGGNITDDRGETITARGVCWSTYPNPTISDDYTSDGSGTGSFSSSITGLTPLTTYYLRAYSTNRIGTAYGNEISFFTLAPNENWTAGADWIDIRDGQSYTTVQIGTQVWMAENLNIGYFVRSIYTPGIIHSDVSNNGEIEKYCYDNIQAYCDTFGGLYDWNEMMQYGRSDDGIVGTTQGICPDGWHIPTDEEWKTLEMYLGMSKAEADATGWRGTDEGGKLKETGTLYWNSPNTGATNESGFTALSANDREHHGNFGTFGEIAIFWSATEDSSYAILRAVRYNTPQLQRSELKYTLGVSVRCIKD